MEIEIIRTELPEKTPGIMTVNSNPNWFKNKPAYTLEDPVRDKNHDGDTDDAGETKVYGDTAINYGRYAVRNTWSPSFKRVTPQIFNLQGGKIKFGDKPIDVCGVRLHGGNKKDDTLGCPLIGEDRQPNMDIYNCHDINAELTRLIAECEKRSEPVYLTIKKADA